MSRLSRLSLLVSLLFLPSCSLFKELSSDDVTRITSEYFDENHDMVFLFDLIASTSRAVHYRASRQRERNHTRYTTHRAGRCRKEFKNLRYSYRKGIDRSRIPHSTAFRQTYGSKALSLPERTDRYPQKRGQSKTNLPYYAFEGIDLRQMAEQIKSRSEKKKKARLIAAESLLFFKRHSICLSTSLVAISFDELF